MSYLRRLSPIHTSTRVRTPCRCRSPADRELVVTTDGFTVQPLEFPGGNIGSLAVHGTVNDLAVSGAEPRFITLSVFLEEGLEIALLKRVIDGLAQAARDCGVAVVAGDTKVVGRGDCDGMYLATTGIGFRPFGTRLDAGPRARRRSHFGERPHRRPWRSRHAGPPGIRPARRSQVGRGQRAAAGAGPDESAGLALHARPHARRVGDRRA